MKKINIGIIGGTGGIGKWFARFFQNQGLKVQISGRKTGPDLPTLVKQCPVVIVSVPIQATRRMIEEVGPLMPKDSLLMDLTSLKEEPVKTMLKSSKSEVIGLHPLFGPRIKTMTGHNIVLCPARTQHWLPWVKHLFIKNKARLIETTPRRHDEWMALVQGLNHLNSIILGLALDRSGFSFEELSQVATPIFKTKLGFLKKIFLQNPRLYAEIITLNPHIPDVLQVYVDCLKELKKQILKKDSDQILKQIEGTLFFKPNQTA